MLLLLAVSVVMTLATSFLGFMAGTDTGDGNNIQRSLYLPYDYHEDIHRKAGKVGESHFRSVKSIDRGDTSHNVNRGNGEHLDNNPLVHVDRRPKSHIPAETMDENNNHVAGEKAKRDGGRYPRWQVKAQAQAREENDRENYYDNQDDYVAVIGNDMREQENVAADSNGIARKDENERENYYEDTVIEQEEQDEEDDDYANPPFKPGDFDYANYNTSKPEFKFMEIATAWTASSKVAHNAAKGNVKNAAHEIRGEGIPVKTDRPSGKESDTPPCQWPQNCTGVPDPHNSQEPDRHKHGNRVSGTNKGTHAQAGAVPSQTGDSYSLQVHTGVPMNAQVQLNDEESHGQGKAIRRGLVHIPQTLTNPEITRLTRGGKNNPLAEDHQSVIRRNNLPDQHFAPDWIETQIPIQEGVGENLMVHEPPATQLQMPELPWQPGEVRSPRGVPLVVDKILWSKEVEDLILPGKWVTRDLAGL